MTKDKTKPSTKAKTDPKRKKESKRKKIKSPPGLFALTLDRQTGLYYTTGQGWESAKELESVLTAFLYQTLRPQVVKQEAERIASAQGNAEKEEKQS